MTRILLCLWAILLTACTSPQQNKIIFLPDSTQNKPREQTGSFEVWQIIESQNGPGKENISAWVRCYLDGGVREVESLDTYRNKYVFVGENRGGNLNSLQQWANSFSAAQDMPRLIVQRVEHRLIASATLYPDDEYGEYFAAMIKKVSDEEYLGGVKEQVFWLKRQRIPIEKKEDDDFPETTQTEIDLERYEFLVLTSIDRSVLEKKIRDIMASIKTGTAPTKEQTTTINKINSAFFEGF